MTINWKIWALVGIIAVAAFVIISHYQFGPNVPAPIIEKAPQAPVAGKEPQQPPVVVKPATGNVDDAVDAILAGVSDDEALFADAIKDAESLTSDSQAISDFGQSYNENEL